MVTAANGFVGIGNTTPQFPLDINGPAATAPFRASIGGTEVMRISSSGYLGIGNSNPVAPLQVETNSTYATFMQVKNTNNTGRTGALIKPSDTDGLSIMVSGNAYTSTLWLSTGGNTSAAAIYHSSPGPLSIGTGYGLNQPLIFGTNGSEVARFLTNPVLCLSGGNTSATGTGIAFPATQSASGDPNTLDDYEEGTWTPTLTAGSVSPTGVTYTYRGGKYTKIGNAVYITGGIYLSSKGTSGSGTIVISGLPFTTTSETAYTNPRSTVCGGNFTTASSAYSAFLFADNSSTILTGRILTNGDTAWQYTEITNTTFMHFELFYWTT